MDQLGGLILSKINQAQKAKYHSSHLYVESKTNEFTEARNWMVVTGGWRLGKMGNIGQRVRSCKSDGNE